MLSPIILLTAIINGLMTGAVYALVALGLTLIYGVLHIINFAHGALLSAALFAAFFAFQKLGLDPYLAAFLIAPAFFALGYGLQRFVIGPASHGDDRNMLLVTLGLAVLIENALLLRLPRRHPHDRSCLRLQKRRSRLHLHCAAAAHFLRWRFLSSRSCCG